MYVSGPPLTRNCTDNGQSHNDDSIESLLPQVTSHLDGNVIADDGDQAVQSRVLPHKHHINIPTTEVRKPSPKCLPIRKSQGCHKVVTSLLQPICTRLLQGGEEAIS